MPSIAFLGTQAVSLVDAEAFIDYKALEKTMDLKELEKCGMICTRPNMISSSSTLICSIC